MNLVTCHLYKVNVDNFVKGMGGNWKKNELTTKKKCDKGISIQNIRKCCHVARILVFRCDWQKPTEFRTFNYLLLICELLDKRQRIISSVEMDYNSICFYHIHILCTRQTTRRYRKYLQTTIAHRLSNTMYIQYECRVVICNMYSVNQLTKVEIRFPCTRYFPCQLSRWHISCRFVSIFMNSIQFRFGILVTFIRIKRMTYIKPYFDY